jgi:hypothetical protein
MSDEDDIISGVDNTGSNRNSGSSEWKRNIGDIKRIKHNGNTSKKEEL